MTERAVSAEILLFILGGILHHAVWFSHSTERIPVKVFAQKTPEVGVTPIPVFLYNENHAAIAWFLIWDYIVYSRNKSLYG